MLLYSPLVFYHFMFQLYTRLIDVVHTFSELAYSKLTFIKI